MQRERAAEGGDGGRAGEASAFGSSIMRSYEEEQRLIQDNALLCSQLHALRRQCAEEDDWRRNARELQACLAQQDTEFAHTTQLHCDEVARLRKEMREISSDLTASQGAEARLEQDVKALAQELDVCRVRLKSQVCVWCVGV